VGEVRRRHPSRAVERTANGSLVETVLAQERPAGALEAEHREQDAGIDPRMAEVADRQLTVSQPHGDGAAVAHGTVDVDAPWRVDQAPQRLVAQARRVQAGELHGLAIG
jgi:hypothetical protein